MITSILSKPFFYSSCLERNSVCACFEILLKLRKVESLTEYCFWNVFKEVKSILTSLSVNELICLHRRRFLKNVQPSNAWRDKMESFSKFQVRANEKEQSTKICYSFNKNEFQILFWRHVLTDGDFLVKWKVIKSHKLGLSSTRSETQREMCAFFK